MIFLNSKIIFLIKKRGCIDRHPFSLHALVMYILTFLRIYCSSFTFLIPLHLSSVLNESEFLKDLGFSLENSQLFKILLKRFYLCDSLFLYSSNAGFHSVPEYG